MSNPIIPIPQVPSDLDGNMRSDVEIARDDALIAQMYVRGKNLVEIRDAVSALYPKRKPWAISVISNRIAEIHRGWLQSALVDFDAAKSKELARIDEMEKEAWDAWERSKERHIRIEYEVADDQVPFSAEKVVDIKRKKKRKTIEATVGDIRYLQMVEHAITMRMKILGLEADSKLQVNWRIEAASIGLTEARAEQVKNNLVASILQAIEGGAPISEEDIIDAEPI